MALGIALVAALWCGNAAAGDDTAKVAILPVADEAGLTAADLQYIQRRMRTTLEGSDLRVASSATTQAAEACGDALCRRRTFSSHGVSYWLSAKVRGSNRMYDVEVSLWSPDDTRPIARTSDRCSVCGQRELAELISAQTLNLRRWITQTSTAPAVLSIASRPSNAEVFVDGRPVGRGRVRHEVQPGRHTVRITAKGHEPTERTVTVTRGVTLDLDVELRPTRAGPNVRPWGIAALTTGIAATTGGAVMLGLHGREYGPRCKDGSANFDDDGDCRYVHQTLAGGIVTTIAGIGLSATGVTLLSVDRRRHDGRRRAELQLKLTPRRLVLSGKF
jgi:hypothetical protein